MKVERSTHCDIRRSALRRCAVCIVVALLVLAAVLAGVIFPLDRIHYAADWMDSGNVRDESLASPDYYLVSKRFPSPNAQQRDRPVVIVVHGFSASTFEWSEFKAYADNPERNILVPQVLLGGHGRSLEDFRKSTWRDWQAPIFREYNALLAQGYSHISLMESHGLLFSQNLGLNGISKRVWLAADAGPRKIVAVAKLWQQLQHRVM